VLLVTACVLAAPVELTVAWAFAEYVPFELGFKLHVAVPLRFAVAEYVAVVPLGRVMVNVTLAPDTRVLPFFTVAVIDTVFLRL
jgi:hypothetical protein